MYRGIAKQKRRKIFFWGLFVGRRLLGDELGGQMDKYFYLDRNYIFYVGNLWNYAFLCYESFFSFSSHFDFFFLNIFILGKMGIRVLFVFFVMGEMAREYKRVVLGYRRKFYLIVMFVQPRKCRRRNLLRMSC